jgi:hypothetical protein
MYYLFRGNVIIICIKKKKRISYQLNGITATVGLDFDSLSVSSSVVDPLVVAISGIYNILYYIFIFRFINLFIVPIQTLVNSTYTGNLQAELCIAVSSSVPLISIPTACNIITIIDATPSIYLSLSLSLSLSLPLSPLSPSLLSLSFSPLFLLSPSLSFPLSLASSSSLPPLSFSSLPSPLCFCSLFIFIYIYIYIRTYCFSVICTKCDRGIAICFHFHTKQVFSSLLLSSFLHSL